MIILICGFMGAGKTTLMNSLVSENSAIGLDLDEEIPKRFHELGESVGEIIIQKGLKVFREIEYCCLEEILREHGDRSEDLIIALGGGALHKNSLYLIDSFEDSALVWVKTPLETCLSRIRGDESRPLSLSGDDSLALLYKEREEFYKKAKVHLRSSEDAITLKMIKMSCSRR